MSALRSEAHVTKGIFGIDPTQGRRAALQARAWPLHA
jgi:hypothetical protein